MLAKAQASGELVKSLASALRALASHFQSADDLHLQHIETHIQNLQAMRRKIEVERKRPATTWTSDDVSRLYRLFVVLESVLSLMAPKLKTAGKQPWGQHLFSEHDFDTVTFDGFEPPRQAAAVKRMLEDQITDLEEAAQDLIAIASSYGVFGLKAEVQKAIKAIRTKFGLETVPPLQLTLWDATRVKDELHIDQAALDELVAKRTVFTVRSWAGDDQYPSFQFKAGAVKKAISYAHKNAAPGFSGWSFAVWAEHHQDENEAFFRTQLEKRGLWKPAWSTAATNQFKDVSGTDKHKIAVGTNLYRVTRSGYSPFYFASVPKSKSASSQAGRFDLQGDGDKGSVYMSESAEGAWREVLDREPVVTLRTLVQRTMWTLTPNSTVTVADVTRSPVDIPACIIRKDTQQLAMRLALHDDGIRYRLRSSGTEIGIVLFGPQGPTLPSPAGLGIWGSSSHEAIADKSLWEYLAFREDEEGQLVVLRRFPLEIVANS